MKTPILYHDNCPDGLMAAAVATRALRLRDAAVEVDLAPAAYNRPLAKIVSPERVAAAKAVYLLDFSLPPEGLDELAGQVSPGVKIVVLDHHKSAVERMGNTFVARGRIYDTATGGKMVDFVGDLPGGSPFSVYAHGKPTEDRMERVPVLGDGHVVVHPNTWAPWSAPACVDLRLDLSRSGAALAWLHFHPGDLLSPLVAHVEDYDLWQHAMPDSRAVHAYLRSLGGDAGAYVRLLEDPHVAGVFTGASSMFPSPPAAFSMANLVAEGRAILRANAVQAAGMARSAEPVTIDGVVALGACAPVLQDDVGEILYRQAESGLAAVWCRRRGGWKVSLRSMPKDGSQVDCAEIAMRRGGGGHKSAAAFECAELPWAWPQRVEP